MELTSEQIKLIEELTARADKELEVYERLKECCKDFVHNINLLVLSQSIVNWMEEDKKGEFKSPPKVEIIHRVFTEGVDTGSAAPGGL
jgi:hypothetical protein